MRTDKLLESKTYLIMLKLTKAIFILFAFSLLGYGQLQAQDGHQEEKTQLSENHSEENEAHASDAHEKGKFNAGEFVIDHVSDSYDWHVTSFGDKHISIPLPIIVYKQTPRATRRTNISCIFIFEISPRTQRLQRFPNLGKRRI